MLNLFQHLTIYEYELTENIESALNREKQLKRWHRQWKINLIKKMNPEFNDLSEQL